MKYKLNIVRDVDSDGDTGFILNLPNGFRFYDDIVHTRGYDTMQELKQSAKDDVPFDVALNLLWDDETQIIWASIVSFWFGTQAFKK